MTNSIIHTYSLRHCIFFILICFCSFIVLIKRTEGKIYIQDHIVSLSTKTTPVLKTFLFKDNDTITISKNERNDDNDKYDIKDEEKEEEVNNINEKKEWKGTLARGYMEWPRIHRKAHLCVLQSLLSSTEATSILDALPTDFDEDRDSVDGMTTFEFYLSKGGDIDRVNTIPGKPDKDPKVLESRRKTRELLKSITEPIVNNRIIPFVNKEYKDFCKGKCTPCFSLVRRYVPWERLTHAMHFDLQALVTVVVSLKSYGIDFEGGLYVSTGKEKNFVALQQGDAVIHQSDLLHGVEVTNGDRVSWILWFQDSSSCHSDPTTWHKRLAEEEEDPVAQFIHAHRLYAFIRSYNNNNENKENDALVAKADFLTRSASHGFARAQNDLGYAFEEGLGVSKNLQKAKELYKDASTIEPDALYNLGNLYLHYDQFEGGVSKALELFFKAAEEGSRPAMHNLGVAYYNGVPSASPPLHKNYSLAAEWFMNAQQADSIFNAAMIYLNHLSQVVPDNIDDNNNNNDESGDGNINSDKTNPMIELGIALLRYAANAGDTDAQMEYGRYLTEGKFGLEPSPSSALKYLKKSASNGNQQAINYIRSNVLSFFPSTSTPLQREKNKNEKENENERIRKRRGKRKKKKEKKKGKKKKKISNVKIEL